jgi:hypothetical protein
VVAFIGRGRERVEWEAKRDRWPAVELFNDFGYEESK